ncbi:MAG: hypothetical protein GW839_07565 [Flavobacteriales bacterium]|nr:hypothetical protein [Flavobacteriia bacterium]NCP06802.1 hypothetical protein [Flavobacteriales bacterium]PIV92626.1 MAG: hypothetical protein COW44_13640 [Flavobacteriaceae bacterium CG17_big_fil_post_rev_8_21_14_2_50_33_15]PIY12949.1 MAG: hypothetical protein COZ17_01900 [Flavobacteriaceae bacterium CG_4_10_14_3_um_filter_33_47]PJB20059.1 MAG: hypothetical protein CO117_02110 [Flavobacteriaceae bacterium CG_4_9_14_3_um_filter_33_16]
MKKTSFFLLGIILGALVTYFFCARQPKTEDDGVKIVKPKGVITIEEAKELNANWTLYRKKAVDSAAQKQGRSQDDSSTLWSLKDIEDYLVYAKNQSDSLGYDMTGLRVYLSVYGKNAGQAKKDLTTMFIVPTGKITKSEASVIMFPIKDGDLPVDPLNDGTGGQGGYPQ